MWKKQWDEELAKYRPENVDKYVDKTKIPVEDLSKGLDKLWDEKDCLYTYKAKVIRILDGDTAELEISVGFNIYITQIIRIKDLNTKEIRKIKGYTNKDVEEGKQAMERAKELLPIDKIVTLKTYKDKQGKYGRFLGDILIGDKSFTQIMKDEGYNSPT